MDPGQDKRVLGYARHPSSLRWEAPLKLVPWTSASPKTLGPTHRARLRDVRLAEVAEVVVAHQVGRGRAHGAQVEGAVLHDEILVLAPQAVKPGGEGSRLGFGV